MKKVFYLFCSLLVALTSCDEPLEEVYEELDKTPAARRTMSITLTAANYESLRGKTGVPAYVNTDKYFISEKQAGDLLPIYLNSAYPHLNDRDAIDVTYNISAPSTVADRVSYTVTDDDYALGGARFKNFDSWAQIETFLNKKYPNSPEGRLVTLTYTWYNGNTSPTSRTVTDSFYFANGKWHDTYVVSDAQYASVDRNRNNAFAAGDEKTLIPAALNKFLKENIVGAKVGDLQYVSYMMRYSSSSTLQEVMPLFFNGSDWVKTTPATLAFIKKQGVWVADPIIRYSLTADDYNWIGDNPNIATQGKRDNLKQFKNFYQRFADNANYWTQAEIISALSALLKHRFPDAQEGQKYEVTYIVHTGPTGPATVVLQMVNGNFVVAQ